LEVTFAARLETTSENFLSISDHLWYHVAEKYFGSNIESKIKHFCWQVFSRRCNLLSPVLFRLKCG